MPFISAQRAIRTKKYSDASIVLKYDDDEIAQKNAMLKKKEAFGALTRDNILQSCISDADFRSSKISVVNIGYHLYVFYIRHQQVFLASQPIKVEFNFDGLVPNDNNGYAIMLTKKLVSVSSDGQRRFDLI